MATLIRLAEEKIVDRMGNAHAAGPAGLAGVTPLKLIPLDPSATVWARFPAAGARDRSSGWGTRHDPFQPSPAAQRPQPPTGSHQPSAQPGTNSQAENAATHKKSREGQPLPSREIEDDCSF